MGITELPEGLPGAIISFPMLGDAFAVNPSGTYQLFGRTFYWYGAIIGLGFLLGVLYCFRRGPREFGVSTDTMTDVILIGLPSTLVGARLYYVLCHLERYRGDTLGQTLWNACKIWEGGSAIPGGLLLMMLLLWVYARRKKIPLGALMDVGVFGLLIGQVVGRWSNFMNREYIGTVTDVFCRMGLTVENGTTYYVHPLFLYESLWNLAGFVFLHIWSKRKPRRFDGQYLLFYLVWYGAIRVLLEPIRSSPLYIPGTRLLASQVIMGAVMLASLALLVLLSRKNRESGSLWVDRVRAEQEKEKKEDTPPPGDASDSNEKKEGDENHEV